MFRPAKVPFGIPEMPGEIRNTQTFRYMYMDIFKYFKHFSTPNDNIIADEKKKNYSEIAELSTDRA